MSRTKLQGFGFWSRIASLAVAAVVATSFSTAGVTPDVLFLPGDLQIDVAGALQRDAAIATGSTVNLVVWSDYRTSPDNGPPSASDGGGSDIYAARTDQNGVSLDPIPLVVSDAPGDQSRPRASWNGTHWLVTWSGLNRSGYSHLAGVRVAQDETVVGHQSGNTARAIRIAADGTVLDPGGIQLLSLPQLSGPRTGRRRLPAADRQRDLS